MTGTNDLKAMFWKECRENVYWAVLGTLCLSLTLAYSVYNDATSLTLSTVWNNATTTLTLGGPFAALALGLLQILPETRRDRWAFLVHRPASRTRLFFGKVLPGLSLYALTTLLPLCGLLVWYARYSRLSGPFDARFLLGPLAAILGGLAFYFAGLLMALRPARWYGSRTLPAVLALLAPFAVTAAQEFWQTALVSLLTAGVLGMAAWGSFTTAGQYAGQTKPARSALGLVLLAGAAGVTVALLTTLYTLAANLFPRQLGPDPAADFVAGFVSVHYQFDAQARPFLVRLEGNADIRNRQTVTDAAGKAIGHREWQNHLARYPLLTFTPLYTSSPGDSQGRYSDPGRYVQTVATENTDPQEQTQRAWYYVSAARQIVGYDVHGASLPPVSRATLYGYLGPRGFSRNADEAGRFDPEAAQTVEGGLSLIRSRHALYVYNTLTRTVRLLQASHSAAGIEGVTSSPETGLIVNADGLYTVYAGDKVRFTTPTFVGPNVYDVQVAVPRSGSPFYFQYYQAGTRTGGQEVHLVTVGGDGRVLGTQALREPPSSVAVLPRLSLRTALAMLIVPPALIVPAAASLFMGSDVKQFLLLGLLSVFTGLLSAVLAGRISRRLGDTRRTQFGWAFGVFWLGIYGVLMLLALREWPARVPCPSCGRKRVVTREACEHCGAAFGRPIQDGTEIFDGEVLESPQPPILGEPEKMGNAAPSGLRDTRT